MQSPSPSARLPLARSVSIPCVADPALDRDALDDSLKLVLEEVISYFSRLDTSLVRPPGLGAPGEPLGGRLPAVGVGSLQAVRELIESAEAGATRSAGPRFFHFVMGGGTPAALAADWLTSALDQIAFNSVSSPFAMRLEQISLSWLKDLLGLPDEWSGVFTTGATMANFTCLAAARHWWAQRHGVDVEDAGMSGLPPVQVLGGGFVHASAQKALAMLGVGRGQLRTFAADGTGRLDTDAMEAALGELDGQPAIMLATAGDVNTGAFDPLAAMAQLAARYGAWLHIDGAFGAFAAVSPMTKELVRGIDRAQSMAVDCHKWLNVPYDCAAALVQDVEAHQKAFTTSAAYLGQTNTHRPTFGNLAPEMSRRARSLAVWATLRAYGRDGYRTMIERHVALARRLTQQVEAQPDLELLAKTTLNVVCFRYHPAEGTVRDLDELNHRLGQAILDDGRVFFGTTLHNGRVAFRPAIVNWRTRPEDVDLIVPIVLEIGATLRAEAEPLLH